jgi:hypothetical protein
MSQCHPAPPIPQRPDLSESIPEPERIDAVQRYIESFDYNYTGKPFLEMKRNRGPAHIQSCSLQIISAALPIQCVEAVFLGCWLTAQMSSVDRIPLSFKSNFRLLIYSSILSLFYYLWEYSSFYRLLRGNIHRHIVLAVRYAGHWGALGISRRENLMNKPLIFSSLSELVMDYKKSYVRLFDIELPVVKLAHLIFLSPLLVLPSVRRSVSTSCWQYMLAFQCLAHSPLTFHLLNGVQLRLGFLAAQSRR